MSLRRSAVAVLLLITFARTAAGADLWRRIAFGGLSELQAPGEGRQGIVDAAVLHRDHVYIATHVNTPSMKAKVLRATLRDDDFWSDVSPSWDATEIVRMISFHTALLVATTRSGIWRQRRDDTWSLIFSSDLPIRSMAVIEAPDGVLLCISRGSLQVLCTTDPERGPWRPFAVPPSLASDSAIGSALIHGFAGRLYLGVGGSSAGTRECAVWLSSVIAVSAPARWGAAWSPLTTDCFGTENTWITSMAAHDGEMFFGTGGHDPVVGARVYRATGSDFEDVTPDMTSGGAAVPRYAAMTVAGRKLYVGNHNNFFGTEVFSRVRAFWAPSNINGFGFPNNVSTNALASDDFNVYAGTINLIDGFEVWTRIPFVIEVLPELDVDFRIIRRESARLRVCIPYPIPCGFEAFERIAPPLEEIRLAFDKAQHPDDNATLLDQGRQLMAQAANEFDLAGQLAKRVQFAGSAKQAHELGSQLMQHVDAALDAIGSAITLAGAAAAMPIQK